MLILIFPLNFTLRDLLGLTGVMTTSILVLLASHDGERWVFDQVDSILSQQGIDLHLLIGDDCSSDATVDIIEAIEANGRMQIIRFNRLSGGAGQSFFRLLREANLSDVGFVAFSDQDDLWHADKLSRAVKMLKVTGADVYSAAVTAFWPDGREQVLKQSPKQTDLDFLFEGAGQGCTFVLRGDFARQIQKFIREYQERLSFIHYHDWLVYAILRALGKRWVFDPQPCLNYRQHGANDTGARGALAGIQKRVSLIRSGWYADQIGQMIGAVSLLEGPRRIIPADFLSAWNRARGLQRRLLLARILFQRGRRRGVDRAVLAASALMGWL